MNSNEALMDLVDFSAGARSLPIMVSTYMKRFLGRFWHVQPRQYVYHDIVQYDVWHTTLEMLDKEYWSAFKMTFMAFEHLVMELTPFLIPTVPHLVSSRPPLSIRKQIKLVIYQLVHGLSCKKMQDLYRCGVFIIQKYTMRICRVLSSREGLFGVYPYKGSITRHYRKI